MILRLPLFFGLISTVALAANEPTRLRDRISVYAIQEAIERAQQMNTPASDCALPQTQPLSIRSSPSRETHVIKDMDGHPNPLSVFTEKEADEIQAYIGSQQHLAHEFIEAGCTQRAVEINRLLKAHGFQAGIIQAFGAFSGEGEGFRVDSPPAEPGTVWKFHTAAMIAVRVKGKIELRVIDRALSTKSMTKEKWLIELKRRSTTDDKIESNVMALDREMTDANIRRATQTLQIYRETLNKR